MVTPHRSNFTLQCVLFASMCYTVLSLFGRTSHGQLTVINSPPTNIARNQSIGSDTQLNVFDDGFVGSNFRANAGSQVTIFGGRLEGSFWALGGSQVTIAGGTVGDEFNANADSRVIISDGSMGDRFDADRGSEVSISGGEFRLDGVLLEGLETVGTTLPLDISAGALLSGVLADGTPFAFSSRDSDDFSPGTLTLSSSILPAVGPPLMTASTDPVPLGIRQGQTLIVDAARVVRNSFNAGMGSTVIVQRRGTVGDNLEAVGAEVTITGGSVGPNFDAFAGSRVTISGGTVGVGFRVFDGGQVTIIGGTVGNGFRAFSGSQVTISGGTVGNNSRWLAQISTKPPPPGLVTQADRVEPGPPR